MNKLLPILFALFIHLPSYGQNGFASWDKKYVPQSYKRLIAEEQAYAAKVKKEEKVPHDYSRFATYRMRGKFTGKSRPIAPNVLQSMKVVCWTWPGSLPKPSELDGLVAKEYVFTIEGSEVWMPIQKVLEEPLRQEIKVGESVFLYCVFLNDKRLSQPLYNTLLISEFRK